MSSPTHVKFHGNMIDTMHRALWMTLYQSFEEDKCILPTSVWFYNREMKTEDFFLCRGGN